MQPKNVVLSQFCMLPSLKLLHRLLTLMGLFIVYYGSSQVTDIITSDATGCQGLTNYGNGDPNHKIYYYPTIGAGAQTPADLSATWPTPVTFIWCDYQVDVTNPWNGWRQKQIDPNTTSTTLQNQGMGAYLLYVVDPLTGDVIAHDICWVQVTRPSAQLPSAGISSPASQPCAGPINVNGITTGYTNGSLTIGGTTTIPGSFVSYTELPDLPLIINDQTTIELSITGTINTLSNLVFAIEAPTSCGGGSGINPMVYLGATYDFNPPTVGVAATGSFLCGPTGVTPFDLTFSNDLSFGSYDACNISTTGVTGNFSANVITSSGAGVDPYDFAPIYGCDATNGDWTVHVWDCGFPGGVGAVTGSITDINLTFTGGYRDSSVPNAVALSINSNPLPLAIINGNAANCGQSMFSTSYTFSQTIIDPLDCTINGYRYYTDPEYVLPIDYFGTINNNPAPQNHPLIINSLTDASTGAVLPFLNEFDLYFTITNVCHQDGIDNGCIPPLTDMQSITLAPISGPATIDPVPPLCVNGIPVPLIVNPIAGEWEIDPSITPGSPSTFDPQIAGAGTHTFTFSPLDPCYTDEDITLLVEDFGDSPPPFVIPPFISMCEDDVPLDLEQFINPIEPGVFDGPGVTPSPSGGFQLIPTNLPALSPISISFTPDNGCPDQVSQPINIYALPDVSIAQGASFNFCQGSDILLNAQGTALNYVWASTGTVIFDDSQIAAPTLTVTGNAIISLEGTDIHGCVNTTEINLIEIANESPNIPPPSNVCEDESPISLVATISDGSQPTNGIWTGTGVTAGSSEFNPATLSGAQIVSYELPDDAVNGQCYSAVNTTFTVIEVPVFTNIPVDATVCAGDVTPLSTAATPNSSTFQWNTSGTAIAVFDNAAIANPSLTLNETADVYITANNNGCNSEASFTLTVLQVTTPTIASVDTFCTNGSNFVFTSTDYNGGTWSSPNGLLILPDGTFDPTAQAPGDYTVEYNQNQQCVLLSSLPVVVSQAPTADAGTPAQICIGAPLIQMTGNTAFSLSNVWTPSQYLTNTNDLFTTVNPTAAGSQTYTLTATGLGGCTASDNVDLTFLENITPVINPIGPFCSTDNITPLTSNQANNGLWSIDGNPLVNNLFDPSAIASDTVTVTYDLLQFCTTPGSIQVAISQPNSYVFNVPSDVCIYDAPIQLSDSIDFTATFSGNGITNALGVFNPASAGSGPINVTCNVNDVCSISITETIVVHNPPTLNLLAGNLLVCQNTPTSIVAPEVDPALTMTYEWSPANDLNNATLASPDVTTANDNTTYTVIGTDEFGCQNSDQILIHFLQPPQVSALSPVIVCPYTPVILNATGNTTGSVFNYMWSPLADIAGEDTPTPTVTLAQTTDYTVTFTDSCGATASATITIPVEPIYNIEASPDTFFCQNSSVTLFAVPGGANPDISWTTTGGLLGADSLSTHIFVDSAGIYTFHVETPLGCLYSDDVFVEEHPLPHPTLPDTSFLCLGDSLILNPGAWDSVQWHNGPTADTLVVQTPGLYAMSVWEDGCSTRDTFLVSQVIVPYFNLGPDRKLCTGDTIFISAELPGEWNTGDIDSVITVNEGGDYVMTVFAGSCFRTDSIFVEEIPLPTCNLPDEVVGCKGQGTVLDAFSPIVDSYYWSTGDTSAAITVFDIDDYRVRVTNYCGSRFFNTRSGLEICTNTIFIPNSFTPDGDNINDHWRVYAANVQSINISVANRFGQVVFQTDNPEQAWLGDLNGNRFYLDDGYYFYTIIFKDENGDTQKMMGSVLMMR